MSHCRSPSPLLFSTPFTHGVSVSCSPGWSGTFCVVGDDLEVLVLLPLPAERCEYWICHCTWFLSLKHTPLLLFSPFPSHSTEEIVTCHLNPGASLCSRGLTFLIMLFEVPEFLTLTYQLLFLFFCDLCLWCHGIGKVFHFDKINGWGGRLI